MIPAAGAVGELSFDGIRFRCTAGEADAVRIGLGANVSADIEGRVRDDRLEAADQVCVFDPPLPAELRFLYASAACMYRLVPLGARYDPRSEPRLNPPPSLLIDRVRCRPVVRVGVAVATGVGGRVRGVFLALLVGVEF